MKPSRAVELESERLDQLCVRLSQLSLSGFTNTFTEIDWPESLDPEAHWYTAPELCSLYPTAQWRELSEAQQKRLSFYEAVNFYSLNIHGERSLLEGLAYSMYRNWSHEVYEYLHHFIEEENRHMHMFGSFCFRYAGTPYVEKKMPFPEAGKQPRGAKLFSIFTKIVIFEEIVDQYNKLMAKDDRLHPVTRRINHIHHSEETRHLGFGRELVQRLFALHSPGWSSEFRQELSRHLLDFLQLTWRQYYNPSIYRDTGLDAPFEVSRNAWKDPASAAFREQYSARVVKFLRNQEIILEAPVFHEASS